MDEKKSVTTRSLIDIQNEFQEYKKFAFSTNLIGLAIVIVLSNAAQKMVNAISEDIFMPIIQFLVSNTGNSWKNMSIPVTEGLNIEIGKLLASAIEFLVTTFVAYLVYFKLLKRLYPDMVLPDKKTI